MSDTHFILKCGVDKKNAVYADRKVVNVCMKKMHLIK